jgi:hypothetical protein
MEKTTIETLWTVLDLFEALCVAYWLDGGWGVDALFTESRPGSIGI